MILWYIVLNLFLFFPIFKKAFGEMMTQQKIRKKKKTRFNVYF